MGYVTRAEYTLELIRDPKSYNYIGRHYFATGFLLATNVSEYTLEAIMYQWAQIDFVTSNRIRFLFFIDNEVELRDGYGSPWFTESGYKRHHSRLLEIARIRGFALSARPGTQVAQGLRHRSDLRWHPEERVRRLAQQMGITAYMPCLVWAIHNKSGRIFVQRVDNLKPEEIITTIKVFCHKFYDDNVVILSQVDQLEKSVEQICSQLDLSIQELGSVSMLLHSQSHLTNVLHSMCMSPVVMLEWLTAINRITEACHQIRQIDYIQQDKKFGNFLEQIMTWTNQSLLAHDIFSNIDKNRHPVNYIANTIINCLSFEDKIPAEILRFQVGTVPVRSTHLFSDLLAAVTLDEVVVCSRDHKDSATRLMRLYRFLDTQYKIDAFTNLSSKHKEYLITLLNMRFVLNDFIKENSTTNQNLSLLYNKVSEILESLFYGATLSISMTLYALIYSRLSEFRSTLEEQIRRIVGLSPQVSELIAKPAVWRNKIDVPLEHISTLAASLEWYTQPYIDCSLPRVPSVLIESDTLKQAQVKAQSLANKINQEMIPIAEAIKVLDFSPPLPSAKEYLQTLQEVARIVVASPGSQVSIADTVYQTKGITFMRDQYNADQVGAQGPHSTAENITFVKLWNQSGTNLDLSIVASQLPKLRTKLVELASEPEHYTSIAAVASAEKEAKAGNGAKMLEHLASVGQWALDIASKIGVSVAVKAIETALGMSSST